jgi:hypothetical protein
MMKTLRSRPAALYKRHASEIVLIDHHGLLDVSLLSNEVSKMDCLCNRVGEANKLYLSALLGDNLLLGRAGSDHPRVAYHNSTAGV